MTRHLGFSIKAPGPSGISITVVLQFRRFQGGDSVCRNRLLVRRDELEESLLRGLSESVLRTEVIDYAVARMEEALRKRFEELDAEHEKIRQRKQKIEAAIEHVNQAFAVGQ